MTNSFYSTPSLDGQYTRQDVRAPYTRGYQSDRLRARKSVESILGTDISPDQKNVKDVLISAGAWFDTEKTDIHFDTQIDGLKKTNTHKGIIRTDTGELLGLHGKVYQDVKIQDIEYILDSLKEKMTISNVLLMNNGSRLYVTATVDENEVTSGDTIKRQLHLYNSHDGSTSLGVFFTDKRMACMNELGLFTGSHAKTAIENGQGLKMKHTANVRRFAHSITRRLDLENQRFKQSIDEYKLMSNTAFKAGDCEKILLEVYGDKINNKTIQDHKYATPREKTYRDLKEYRDIVNLTQYGQGLSLTNGETVYKFFNAVTEYETHFSGTAKKNKNEIKLNSLYHGVTAQRINKARKACLALCS